MSSTFELDLWRRAETLFEAALDRSEAERLELLKQACGGDQALFEIVESLLLRDQEDLPFLETPVTSPRSITSETGLESQWVGRRLGAYRLVRLIGVGGMSSVFLGERVDGEVEQQVAVKVIREEARRPVLLRSLRNERRILAKLDHPNIARSLDGGTTVEGVPYVVLEYLEGMPITEYCDIARLNIGHRLELFRKVCDAVDYAHRRLVVHRDLKPSNILVTAQGEPKLLDFGIAKLLDGSQDSEESTQIRDRFLTPNYASPEQISGEPVTMASDVYSLGVLLYQLLTGLRPQSVDSASAGRAEVQDLVRPSAAATATSLSGDPRVLESPIRRAEVRSTAPVKLRRELSGDLDCIVLQCLRRSPEERYHSVNALGEDLRRYRVGLPVAARPPKLSYRLRKFVRRHQIGMPLSSLAITALIGLGLGFVQQRFSRDTPLRGQPRARGSSPFRAS